MNRGVQAAAGGMRAFQLQLDVVANNLANLNTTAFKADGIAFAESLERRMVLGASPKMRDVGTLGSGPDITGRYLHFQTGPAMRTDNALDVMLDKPKQFFVVQTNDGLRYTRDGSFGINSDGRLATRGGHIVLDANGQSIEMPAGEDGSNVSITADGRVVVNGVDFALLGIVEGDLRKMGDNLWAGSPTQADAPHLLVGSLEGSNVDAIHAMVQMISLMRGFEGAQRAVRTQDELTEKLLSSLVQR